MTRFDEGPTVWSDGARLIAMLIVLIGGSSLAEWVGPQTGSKLLSGILGFLTGVLVALIQHRLDIDVDDAEPDNIGTPSSRLAINAAKWIFAIGATGFLCVLLVRKAVSGFSYFDATILGFWLSLVSLVILQALRSHNPFRRAASQ